MKIFTLAWKDTLLRFADRAEILFFLVLPLVFTYLVGGGAPQAAFEGIRLPIVNDDNSRLSAELIAALAASDAIQPQAVDRAGAEQLFDGGQSPAWLYIPAGFEQDLANGGTGRLELRRQPNQVDADAAERAVRTAVGQVDRLLAAARMSVEAAGQQRPFADAAEQQSYLEKSLQRAQAAFAEAPAQIRLDQPADTSSESQYDPGTQASAGQLITWVLVPLLGTSAMFATERRQKTLARLLTTPTRKLTFLLGTIGGQFALALVQMGLLIAFAVLVLQVPWGRSPAGLAIMISAFGLAAVALGTLLGTLVKTEKQANNLSILLGMALALLGGCWWPLEMFPAAMQKIVLALPTTWAMQGLTELALHGDLLKILPAAGVLLGFALLFFITGVQRFRYE